MPAASCSAVLQCLQSVSDDRALSEAPRTESPVTEAGPWDVHTHAQQSVDPAQTKRVLSKWM